MKKTRRNYNGDPLAYFKKHHSNKKITRGQLQKEDKGLYGALLRAKQIDAAIPNILHRDFKKNPLTYFKEHYKNKGVTRGQLSEKDSGLYTALRKAGQLKQAIPEKQGGAYRGYENPLVYFKEYFGNKNVTRYRLQKEDVGLYGALRRAGQLDKAIPQKRVVTYRGYENPLLYFKEKYGNKKITRKQLREEDNGLYLALKRTKQLDNVTKRKTRNFKGNPLAYFEKHYSNRKITRSQLQKEDASLYSALRKARQIEQAIPERQQREFKSNPLAYFEEYYSNTNITRGQLRKEDAALYNALIRSGQLDLAIPKPITSQFQYKSFLEEESTAKKLTALAISSNGLSGAVLDRLVELYPDRLKKSKKELPKWIESLGPYLGPFILPLKGNIAPSIDALLVDLPEKILDEDFRQILFTIIRDTYMQQFNSSPKGTLKSLEMAVKNEKQAYVKELLKQVHNYYSDVYNLEIPGIRPLVNKK